MVSPGEAVAEVQRAGDERVPTASSLPWHSWQRPQLLVDSPMAPALVKWPDPGLPPLTAQAWWQLLTRSTTPRPAPALVCLSFLVTL